MRLPLATDLKTRTGAPEGKDARIKNAYVETRGEQGVVRKRPIAQGGINVATVGSIAQGGIAYTTSSGGSGVFFLNGDTQGTYIGDGTTWSAATNYSVGDHVTYNWVDYWALTDNLNQNPTTNPEDWSTEYVPAVPFAGTYAAFDPLYKDTNIALSNADLTVTISSDGGFGGLVRTNMEIPSSGKWYFEVTVADVGSVQPSALTDILSIGVSLSTVPKTSYPGATQSWARRLNLGSSLWNGVSADYGSEYNGASTAYGTIFTSGDVAGVAIDMNARTITIYKNGVSEGVMYTFSSGSVYFVVGGLNSTTTTSCTANFGASSFSYSVPSGYNRGLYTL